MFLIIRKIYLFLFRTHVNLRLYATGSNLLCITGYSGQDPEVNTSSNKMVMGFDYSAYPKSRSYIVGVNVTF